MAKKTDTKTATKTVKKKAVAKPATTPKPATATKPAGAAKPAAAEPASAKLKTPLKAAAKPAAKKMALPTTAAKKPAGKTKAELNRPQISGEAAVPQNSSPSPVGTELASKFFYFLSETIDPQVTRARPSSGQVSQFAEFTDVRQHAIDFLVDLIDRCEVRLWQIKRADSLEAYQQLVREHDHPPLPATGEEALPAPS